MRENGARGTPCLIRVIFSNIAISSYETLLNAYSWVRFPRTPGGLKVLPSLSDMYLWITILLSLATISCVASHHVVPRQATQLPGYTKLSSDQVEHLRNKGFGPTVPTAFGKSSALEEDDDDEEELNEDSSVASTQVRRPVFAENAYYQNAIPVQARPQPQPQVVRRPVQQQYRPQQYLEVST